MCRALLPRAGWAASISIVASPLLVIVQIAVSRALSKFSQSATPAVAQRLAPIAEPPLPPEPVPATPTPPPAPAAAAPPAPATAVVPPAPASAASPPAPATAAAPAPPATDTLPAPAAVPGLAPLAPPVFELLLPALPAPPLPAPALAP